MKLNDKSYGGGNRTLDEEISSIKELFPLIDVDVKTGKIYWKNPPRKSIPVGSEAGSKTKHGYVAIGYKKTYYRRHRIIFYVANGYLPLVVDHKHGVEAGDGIDNLQEITQQHNIVKMKMSKRNASGYRGVSFHQNAGKWQSCIRHNRKTIYLGLYETPELAYDAYLSKRKELFGEI
ncbi:HNH endonuclease [Enterobacter asburiae]|uniref:HNH endonuclease n=1 Tax=Enterobacter asburiae TaxID=61645 RepID=UPI003D6E2341